MLTLQGEEPLGTPALAGILMAWTTLRRSFESAIALATLQSSIDRGELANGIPLQLEIPYRLGENLNGLEKDERKSTP